MTAFHITSGHGTGWEDRGPAELLDHLESTHHALLRAELPRLSDLGRQTLADDHGRHRSLERVVDLYEELRLDLGPHLVKEERVLFPLIRELVRASRRPSFPYGSIGTPISVMLREHDRTDDFLACLRDATDGYRAPSDASLAHRAYFAGLQAIDVDTQLHMRTENETLFPAVLALESSLGE